MPNNYRSYKSSVIYKYLKVIKKTFLVILPNHNEHYVLDDYASNGNFIIKVFLIMQSTEAMLSFQQFYLIQR